MKKPIILVKQITKKDYSDYEITNIENCLVFSSKDNAINFINKEWYQLDKTKSIVNLTSIDKGRYWCQDEDVLAPWQFYYTDSESKEEFVNKYYFFDGNKAVQN